MNQLFHRLISKIPMSMSQSPLAPWHRWYDTKERLHVVRPLCRMSQCLTTETVKPHHSTPVVSHKFTWISSFNYAMQMRHYYLVLSECTLGFRRNWWILLQSCTQVVRSVVALLQRPRHMAKRWEIGYQHHHLPTPTSMACRVAKIGWVAFESLGKAKNLVGLFNCYQFLIIFTSVVQKTRIKSVISCLRCPKPLAAAAANRGRSPPQTNQALRMGKRCHGESTSPFPPLGRWP